ncbi:acyl-CoA dehydrogenase family protein [Embleya sp. NPDC001921]
MPVDFSLTDEQLQARAGARAFAQAHLTKVAATIADLPTPEERFRAIRPFYEEMVRAGFLKGLIPEADGGTGVGLLDLAITGEEITGVDVNVSCGLFSSGLALQPLLHWGTAEQKARLLEPFLVDDGAPLCAFAFSEVGGTANFDNTDPEGGIRTVARREGDEWVISGRKQFTTNGAGWEGKGADLYTVVCRTDLSKPPQESLAVIAVPGPAEGIHVGRALDTMGHRAALSPQITFDEVRVPVGNILGEPGDGIEILTRTFSWSAALVGSGCVAVMKAAFDAALEFARTERRGGSAPILTHQNVGFKLADVKTRIEAARYLTWKACHYFEETGGKGLEIPVMSKIFASETAVRVIVDLMEIVGVESYANDLPFTGFMQDVLAFPLYDGGNMGIRRRQLHELFALPSYDAAAAAEGRLSVSQ